MSGHIPWREVDLRLRAGRTVWLATTRPDGRPHAMPVWYLWEEGGDAPPGRLYFVTGGQKARNLEGQPWGWASLGDPDDGVILDGPVEVVTETEERGRVVDAYAEKYVDGPTGAMWRIGEEETLYRLRPRRVMSWEYGNDASRTTWTFRDE